MLVLAGRFFETAVRFRDGSGVGPGTGTGPGTRGYPERHRIPVIGPAGTQSANRILPSDSIAIEISHYRDESRGFELVDRQRQSEV